MVISGIFSSFESFFIVTVVGVSLALDLITGWDTDAPLYNALGKMVQYLNDPVAIKI